MKTISIILILIVTFGIDTASFAQKYNGMSITINGVSFNMIYVTGGTLKIDGNQEDDYTSVKREKRKRITVDDYYIGETEVTCGLWNAVFGYDSIVEKKVKVKYCKFSNPNKESNVTSVIESQLDTLELPSIEYQDWDDKWTQPINNKVFGIVVDETGNDLAGVLVVEKGTLNGTLTDIEGNFELNMQNVDHKLEFSYVGCITKETSAGGNMNVVLKNLPFDYISRIQPKGDNYPMGWISSRSINEFLQKLNSITSLNFRLPTSDEWEFAARGGNKSHGYKYSGSNIYEEVGQTPKIRYLKCPVKEKAPNELGIYDMSGNVDELCIDAASYSGYSYNNFSDYNCNGYYPFDFPGDLGNLFGFRIVLSSQNSEE